MTSQFGVYVHIPYCSRKCPYCDFTTYAVPRVPQEDYTAALVSEVTSYAAHEQFDGRGAGTVFFGGGTPSLIDPAFIDQILTAIASAFPSSAPVEVTMEANPGAVSLARLSGYREAGVNRISFGAQSLNAKHLSMLGRTHTRNDVLHAVENARKAGIGQISLDLLFGIPEQTLGELESDLEEMLNLGIDHISTYGLTYEKGTPYFQSVARGALKPLSDDATADMYEFIIDRLLAVGFEHYEISNFAKNETNRSRHNLSYWIGKDYLGFGVGAHSFCGSFEGPIRTGGKRWANLAQPNEYMQRLKVGESVVSWSESLTEEQVRFEHLFVGLRRIEGISISNYAEEFGTTVNDRFSSQIETLVTGGLLTVDGDSLKLTRRGLLLADSVLEMFAA